MTAGRSLGPVTISRAWYHCAACEHGLAPGDAELDVARVSMSPGLTAMNDRVAAAAWRGCALPRIGGENADRTRSAD